MPLPKKYFTKQDFEDGLCDENGIALSETKDPVVPKEPTKESTASVQTFQEEKAETETAASEEGETTEAKAEAPVRVPRPRRQAVEPTLKDKDLPGE